MFGGAVRNSLWCYAKKTTTIGSPNYSGSFLCNFVSGMKRFSDGNMGGPFKRSRMGPDDIEVRLLIPSKVRINSVLYF